MSRLLGTIEGVPIREDDTGRVFFTANAAIDADGANGQHGHRAAYMVGDKGSDYLENGGMKMRGGRVVCAHSWARDIVILGDDNEPKVFPGGIIASMTWYRHQHLDKDDPAAYIDSESVRYVVVPPLIVQKTKGVVRGCLAHITYNGKTVICVVADKGPSKKVGELSIAAARAIGIPSSPKNGGISSNSILYELWPGSAALVDGFQYELQPS